MGEEGRQVGARAHAPLAGVRAEGQCGVSGGVFLGGAGGRVRGARAVCMAGRYFAACAGAQAGGPLVWQLAHPHREAQKVESAGSWQAGWGGLEERAW